MVYTNAINLYFPHSKDLLQPQQRDFYDRTAHCRSNKIWFQGCSQNESTKKPVKKHPIAFPTRLVIVAGRQNACFYTPWPFFLVYNEKERKRKEMQPFQIWIELTEEIIQRMQSENLYWTALFTVITLSAEAIWSMSMRIESNLSLLEVLYPVWNWNPFSWVFHNREIRTLRLSSPGWDWLKVMAQKSKKLNVHIRIDHPRQSLKRQKVFSA